MHYSVPHAYHFVGQVSILDHCWSHYVCKDNWILVVSHYKWSLFASSEVKKIKTNY